MVRDVTIAFNIIRARLRAALVTAIRFDTLAGFRVIVAFPVLLAAGALATFGHEGPDGHESDDNADGGQDDSLVHEGVEELVLERCLFIDTRCVYLLHIHLQVRVRMVFRKLLEPLVTCKRCIFFTVVFEVL